jgi:3-amino-4-hydroxybenzoic acid synthase
MSTPTRHCWLDLRESDQFEAVAQEALHLGIDALVTDSAELLTGFPSTIDRVLWSESPIGPHTELGLADIVVAPMGPQERQALEGFHPERRFAPYVDIHDAETLEVACETARTEPLSVLRFRDPTKIPLEIVLAAASSSTGSIITVAGDAEEAAIIYSVLERGPDGVLMPGRSVGDATALRKASSGSAEPVDMTELTVVGTRHVGLGERACVDTCSYLGQDEGILVGSTSKGLMLCVSETHPLPYMPTRPFRVNAGALHSYTIGEGGRTRYLSELRAGERITAVRADGSARLVTVGRVKIESRPLISIDAVSADGRRANLILQHDWHVRVLGPGAQVLNSTELRPGHLILGHLPVADRHVGYPIDEFCLEQ